MAKRRGNGEGTIYKVSNGTWRVQVSLPGYRLSRTFKTKLECHDWIKTIQDQTNGGLSHLESKLTIADYFAYWLSTTKATKARSTWVHYEQLTRHYIVPSLGSTRLKDLRPEQIQTLYNRLLVRKVGIHTVRKIHITLHSALEQAFNLGILNRNPAHFAKPPKEPFYEMAILNESQVRQLLAAARGHCLEALLQLAIVSGMRQMELLGLKWIDLDWNKGTLRIERQLLRSSNSSVQFSAPKTRFSKRTISLGQKTVEILHLHNDRQQVDRVLAGDLWQEHGLMFPSRVGTPIHHRNLLRDFKILLKTAGLPLIRFHDLRHTAASLLLNQGVPVIVVSRRLGHAKTSITLDVYGHLIPTMQEEIARMIDNLVTPAPEIINPMTEGDH